MQYVDLSTHLTSLSDLAGWGSGVFTTVSCLLFGGYLLLAHDDLWVDVSRVILQAHDALRRIHSTRVHYFVLNVMNRRNYAYVLLCLGHFRFRISVL